MLLLEVMSRCSDPALAAILHIIKEFMRILWIVGPILAIVGGVMAFIKLMTNPEEKKYKKILQNIIIALLMLFLIPAIVNTVMILFDETFEVAACWNVADEMYDTAGKPSEYEPIE